MKYCHNCGTGCEDSARFCPGCGAALDPPSWAVPAAETPDSGALPSDAPETVFAPNPGPVSASGESRSPEKPVPRKKRRLLWLWILLPVLALLIAGGLIFYFLFWNSPEWKLERALDKTGGALKEIFESCDNLEAFSQRYETLTEDRQTSTGFRFHYALPEASIAIALEGECDYDYPARLLDGSGQLRMEADGDAFDLALRFSADEDTLMLELPALAEGTYSVDTKRFGEAYKGSSFYEEDDGIYGGFYDNRFDWGNLSLNFFPEAYDWDDFKREHSDKLEQFLDTLTIMEAGTETVSLGGESRDCTAYVIRFSKKQLSRLVESYAEALDGANIVANIVLGTGVGGNHEILDSLLDSLDQLRVYLDDRGYLAGLEFELSTYGDTASLCRIVLDGEENPWSRIVLSLEDEDGALEPTLICTLTEKEEGFAIGIGDTEGENGLRIECDDAAETIVAHLHGSLVSYLTGSNSTELLTVQYGSTSSGVTLRLSADFLEQTLEVGLEVSALSGKPAMLAARATNLFQMSEAELEALEEEITSNAERLFPFLAEAETDESRLEGAWYATIDLSEEVANAISEEIGAEIQLTTPLIMHLTLTFFESGEYLLELDDEAFAEAMTDFLEAMKRQTADLIDSILANYGITSEADREMFLDTFKAANGITLEEYIDQLFSSLRTDALLSDDTAETGTYSAADGILVLTPDDSSSSESWIAYSFDGDTLVLETESIEGLPDALRFTK